MKSWVQRMNFFSSEIGLSGNLKVAEESINNVRKACNSSIAAILDLNVLHREKCNGEQNLDPWKNSQFWKSGEQINQQLVLIEDTDSPVRQVMEQIAQMTQKIAKHHNNFEAKVQGEICQGGEIEKVLENSQQSIKEDKEILQKKMREYANVQQRYKNCKNRSKNASDDLEFSERIQPKERQLRDEAYALEKAVFEADSRLAQRLYSIYANENEYANNLAEYVFTLKTLLDDTMKEVNECLPKIKNTLATTIHRKVFGVSLDTHLSTNKVKIAIPLKIASLELLNHLKVEGLFRVGPDVNQLKRYKAAIDAGFHDERKSKQYTDDPHLFTAVIKSYLRELPEPLLGSNNFEDWKSASDQKDKKKQYDMVMEILQRLPESNRTNIGFISQFLARVAQFEMYNKMSVDNLVIVLGPNMIWEKNSLDKNPVKSVKEALITLIEHSKTFFKTNYLEESKFKYYSFKSVDNENLSKGELRKSKKLMKQRERKQSEVSRHAHSNGTQFRERKQSKGLVRQNTRRFSSPAPAPVLFRSNSENAQEKVEKRLERSSRGRALNAESFEELNKIINKGRPYRGTIIRQDTTGQDITDIIEDTLQDTVDGKKDTVQHTLDVDGTEERRVRSESSQHKQGRDESLRQSAPGRLETICLSTSDHDQNKADRRMSMRKRNTMRSSAILELDMWSSYLEDLLEEDPLESCYQTLFGKEN